jgi:Predicted membrane protein
MTQSTQEDIAKLLLRLTLGILIFFHGWAKVQSGLDGIEGMLAAHGWPVFMAWGVYVGEVIAPILLIIGLFTRVAAAIVAINMIVAVALAHMGQLTEFTKSGGWSLELQAMFLVAAIALMLLGAGRYAVIGGRSSRWN